MIGVTERPRSLNPGKAIAMVICPIIVRFIANRIYNKFSIVIGPPRAYLSS